MSRPPHGHTFPSSHGALYWDFSTSEALDKILAAYHRRAPQIHWFLIGLTISRVLFWGSSRGLRHIYHMYTRYTHIHVLMFGIAIKDSKTNIVSNLTLCMMNVRDFRDKCKINHCPCSYHNIYYHHHDDNNNNNNNACNCIHIPEKAAFMQDHSVIWWCWSRCQLVYRMQRWPAFLLTRSSYHSARPLNPKRWDPPQCDRFG